ncbi:hypothetical protein AWW68_11385 [Roseivirga spongicola]|uniref:Uncharacterized protein n=1 Tax=Roseivirga spongicola TaxID=333140 RepID=A0A150X3J4_9BACT|nr:hypothetical protein AWW68_11385 [Roseivirga spongicola]
MHSVKLVKALWNANYASCHQQVKSDRLYSNIEVLDAKTSKDHAEVQSILCSLVVLLINLASTPALKGE